MEQFVVSARKYRPKRFTDVVGQQGVTITLRNALRSGHLAQSFLFCGPRGVGKTTCARILAKAINCLQPTAEFEPCGHCNSCKSFEQNTSFNIHELDAASNNSVDDIRELVSQVRIPPQAGKYKVYIIDEVHMLSPSAFNAFLKTLEEPPGYAIFILATTEKHKIIPTILSRCQIYEFSRITVNDVVEHLKGIAANEGITADANALNIIGQKADGALRDALSMFDRLVNHVNNELTLESVLVNLNILDYEYYFRFTDYMLTQNSAEVMLLFDEVQRKGFEGDLLISGLCEHFRNLMVCKNTKTAILLEVSGDLRDRYLNQALLASSSFLLNAMNIASQSETSYKTSKNKRLHTELCLLKLSQLNAIFKISLSEDASEVKKNANSFIKPTESEKKTLIDSEGFVAKPLPTITPSQEREKVIQPETKLNRTTEVSATTSQAVKEPVLRTKKLPTLGIKSLGNLEEKIQQEKEAALAEKNNLLPIDHVSETVVKTAWNKFAKHIASEKPNIASVYNNNNPDIKDGVISVVVNTLVQKNEFEDSKQMFLDFMKQHYDVRAAMVIEVVKDADDVIRRAFTKEEKLQVMINKNPHVLDLIQQLDLKP